MTTQLFIRPEDILPDGNDTAIIRGVTVRKGTVAAFLANCDLLENVTAEEQKEVLINALRNLAPQIVASGLHKLAVFKNPVVEQVLVDAEIVAK